MNEGSCGEGCACIWGGWPCGKGGSSSTPCGDERALVLPPRCCLCAGSEGAGSTFCRGALPMAAASPSDGHSSRDGVEDRTPLPAVCWLPSASLTAAAWLIADGTLAGSSWSMPRAGEVAPPLPPVMPWENWQRAPKEHWPVWRNMLQIIRFADCGGGLERAVPGSWGVPASLRSWLPLLPPPNADPAPEPVCSGAKALPSEGGNGGSAPCMRCRSATRAGEAAREPAALAEPRGVAARLVGQEDRDSLWCGVRSSECFVFFLRRQGRRQKRPDRGSDGQQPRTRKPREESALRTGRATP